MTTQSVTKRSLITRIKGYVRRKLSARMGPSISSIQNISEQTFLKNLIIESSPSNRATEADTTKVIGHFGRRVESSWPDVPDVLTDLRIDLSQLTEAEIVERADRALSGDLHPSGTKPNYRDDGGIDWSANPSSSREWLLMIHRHSWWSLWAVAYRYTANEKYSQAFVSQLTDWIDNHPLPRRKCEHFEPWRLMEAALRMRVSWIPAFGVFYRSPHFTDETKLRMLRVIGDHARFLHKFCTNRNHLVRESNGLIATGFCFPEFQESAAWVETGLHRLDDELAAQINPDGSHIEMSVGYQWLTIDEFEVTRSLLSRYGSRLPHSDLDRSLQKLYQFLAGVIRPDRSFPQLNDGFILWNADRLREAGVKSGWDDVAYAASGGTTGARPSWCSTSFPNAGLHIMRSDWSHQARYLAFDTGPFGGPHGHEDMLSIELFAHGAPFIVDPGSYTYERGNPYREYFVGSSGHNTVLVDGQSQIRRWNKAHMTPAVNDLVFGLWQSNDRFDFASGQYVEGYAPYAMGRPDNAAVDETVRHRRDIVFIKPDYWLMFDSLSAASNHNYDFLFHLAPDVVVTEIKENSALCLSERNGARLLVQVLSPETLGVTEVVGADSPIQGWYSPDHHQKVAAPTLVFSARHKASMRVIWLLYPLAPNMSAREVRAEYLPRANSTDMRCRVRHPGGSDEIAVTEHFPAGDDPSALKPATFALCRDGADDWTTG